MLRLPAMRELRWRVRRLARRRPIYFSTVRCPFCGKRSKDQMPGNASVYFYRCMRCNELFTPLPGRCCVYCSYGDVPCPWSQQGKSQ